MKVWLPYVVGGSGTDVYVQLLARGLQDAGLEVSVSAFAHRWQYLPAALRLRGSPADVDVTIANSWNGFAFARPGTRLVVVEHHCIFDLEHLAYRSRAQGLFHEGLVRRFERASFAAADSVVTVSQYTADSLRKAMGVTTDRVILNGVDLEFFRPMQDADRDPAPVLAPVFAPESRPFRLLFVGNHSVRKGVDLLPPIMEALGPEFELRFTGGLRSGDRLGTLGNGVALGRLDQGQLLREYQEADAFLFPSRLEGFGSAAAEALACATPVITTRGSALPEVVSDGVTGILCPRDDIAAFVDAARRLRDDRELHARMSRAARRQAVERFGLDRMAGEYRDLCRELVGRG